METETYLWYVTLLFRIFQCIPVSKFEALENLRGSLYLSLKLDNSY